MTLAQKRTTTRSFTLSSKLRGRLEDFIAPIVVFAVLLVLWQLFSSLPGATLPGPIKVVQETWILFYK